MPVKDIFCLIALFSCVLFFVPACGNEPVVDGPQAIIDSGGHHIEGVLQASERISIL